MTEALPRVRRDRAVDVAANLLRERILSGDFPAGSLLPPERRLSESLGINRLTLRAAISVLESERLVRPRQGEGVRVLDFRETAGLDVLCHLSGPERVDAARSFFELRRAIAAEAVALAAQRARPEQLAELRRLAELQRRERDLDAFVERDLEFVRALLQAADSLAMELFTNTAERVYRAHPEVAKSMAADLEAVRDSYAATVELMTSADPESIRVLVRKALETVDDTRIAWMKKRYQVGRRKRSA